MLPYHLLNIVLKFYGTTSEQTDQTRLLINTVFEHILINRFDWKNSVPVI